MAKMKPARSNEQDFNRRLGRLLRVVFEEGTLEPKSLDDGLGRRMKNFDALLSEPGAGWPTLETVCGKSGSYIQRRCKILLWAALVLLLTIPGAIGAFGSEPLTLLGTIVKWRYPEASIVQPSISDAATVDAQGDRTVPSTILKTTMLTADSVEDVLAFYRRLLTRSPDNDAALGLEADGGRSVAFSDESEGRPFAFHVISVNDEHESTTLIVTRGKSEEQTRITWTQYRRHVVPE